MRKSELSPARDRISSLNADDLHTNTIKLCTNAVKR